MLVQSCINKYTVIVIVSIIPPDCFLTKINYSQFLSTSDTTEMQNRPAVYIYTNCLRFNFHNIVNWIQCDQTKTLQTILYLIQQCGSVLCRPTLCTHGPDRCCAHNYICCAACAAINRNHIFEYVHVMPIAWYTGASVMSLDKSLDSTKKIWKKKSKTFAWLNPWLFPSR